MSKTIGNIGRIGELVQGVILVPRNFTDLNDISIEAFADEDLKNLVASTKADNTGRFKIIQKTNKKAVSLWFRWKYKDKSGRTPRLDPWQSSGPLRIPCYTLKEPDQGQQIKTQKGRIHSVSGQPASEFTVWLVEQTALNCQRLSVSTTNEEGAFELKYSPEQLLDKKISDLRILVLDCYGDPIKETSDSVITLPDQFVRKTWIEDRNVQKTFTFVRKESQTQPLRPEDVLYLIEKQNVSNDTADLLKKAVGLSQSSGIDVPVALAITAAGPDTQITDAIRAGINAGWLDADTENRLDVIEDAVEEHHYRRRRRLSDDYPRLEQVFVSRLGDNETLRLTASRLWREAKQELAFYEERLKQDADLRNHAAALRFTVELADQVQRHIPIIQNLENEFNTGNLNSVENLGGWGITQWEQFISDKAIELPDKFIDVKNQEEAIHAYARSLRYIFENKYQNSAIRNHVENNKSVYPWGDALHNLLTNKAEIDVSLPVPSLERDHPGLFKGRAGQKAKQGLATIQRLRRITESVDPLPALTNAGLNSARAVAQYSRHNFIKNFKVNFDDNSNQARIVHDRAVKVADLARYTYSELSDQFNKTPLAILKHTPKSAEHQQALATWREIFGEQDLSFCDCAHCKSIFGPAAYLFDTLLFLERYSGPESIAMKVGPTGSSNVLDSLNRKNENELVEWIQDDPVFRIGSERAVGVRLSAAKKIVEQRKALGGAFTSFKQVTNLKGQGIGDDTLHDIIYTSWGAASTNINKQALEYLNSVTNKEELNKKFKRDPLFSNNPKRSNALSVSTAQNIINARDQLQGGFSSLRQVADVKGVGIETLHNIQYSFFEKSQKRCIEVNWVDLGRANGATTLAAMDDRFFITTEQQKLKMRDSNGSDTAWITLGELHNTTSLNQLNSKLLGVGPNGVYQLDPSDWLGNEIQDFDIDNVSDIACSDTALFVISDLRLFGRTLGSSSPMLKASPVSVLSAQAPQNPGPGPGPGPGPQPEEWHDLGAVENIVCLTMYSGKLYGLKYQNSKHFLVTRDVVFSNAAWNELEQVPIFAEAALSITASGNYLFALDSQYKVYRRPAIPSPLDMSSWTQVSTLDDIEKFAISGPLLYGVENSGALLIRESTVLIDSLTTQPHYADWIEVGNVGNITALDVCTGKLYCSHGNDGIRLAETFPKFGELPRTVIDDTNSITALATATSYYYAASTEGKLLVRPISGIDQAWTEIGQAENVIALTTAAGWLFAATSDHKLLMRDLTLDDVPWIEAGQNRPITALSSKDNTLYAVDEEDNLLSFELLFESQSQTDNTLLEQFRARRPDVPALALTCKNTNIEVPHIDLVNELLSDIIGSSLCAGFANSGISTARNTTGTSEERRALPEYEPPQHVLETLEKAKRPWQLPYDHALVRAEQARRQTGVDENHVSELLHRLESLNYPNIATQGTFIDDKQLARRTLKISQQEADLITNAELDLSVVWGDEIDNAVTVGAVTVAEIQKAGRFDETKDNDKKQKAFFPSFEAAIETEFVRSGIDIKLSPTGTCNPAELLLDAPNSELTAILDRLHRFERLRRKTGWTANQLDNAISVMNGNLNENTLTAIGLLVYIQRRLDINPDSVHSIFTDPSLEKPYTLRREKQTQSAFERLFSKAPIELPEVPSNSTEYSSTSDSVVATIADRVGVSPEEVRYVFANQIVGFNNVTVFDPLDILLDGNSPRDEDQAKAVWHSAVASVYRVTLLAKSFKESLKDIIALTRIWNKPTLLKPQENEQLLPRLTNTLGLLDLQRQVQIWPLPPSEVLYVVTDDPVARKEYALDAIQTGKLLHRLHTEILDVVDKNRSDVSNPLLGLRSVLEKLLNDSENSDDYVNNIIHLIEWSADDPAYNQEAISLLPVGTVNNLSLIEPALEEQDDANTIIDSAIDALEAVFRRHITQARISANSIDQINGADYDNAFLEFANETRATLATRSPNMETIAGLVGPLIWSDFDPQEPVQLENARNIIRAIMLDAYEQVSRIATSVRSRAIERWLPVLNAALLRNLSEARVYEVLADAFSIEVDKSRILLKNVLKHDGQSLVSHFVDQSGRSKLEPSLVKATYTTAGSQQSVYRLEPSLQLDWINTPPPNGIDAENFQVSLDARLLTSLLTKVNLNQGKREARNLIVETTGAVSLTINNDATKVLELSAGGRIQRQSWDCDLAIQVIGDQVTGPGECVAHFSVIFTNAGDADQRSQSPLFRVWIDSDEGEIPLVAGIHSQSLSLIDKAVRIVRSTTIPGETWVSLTNLPKTRRIDLNEIPVTNGRNLILWSQIAALDFIWKRARTEDQRQILLGMISGSVTPANDLAPALGLTDSEYRDVKTLIDNFLVDKAGQNIAWTNIGSGGDVSELTLLNNRFFGIENQWLKMKHIRSVNDPWISIGKVGDVNALTNNGNKFFSADQNNVYQLDSTEWLGQELLLFGKDNITALACSDTTLFVVSDSMLYSKLLDESLEESANPWIELGDATNIVCITFHSGQLYGIRYFYNKNSLVVRTSLEQNAQWTELQQDFLYSARAMSISSLGDYLYVLDSSNNLYKKIPSSSGSVEMRASAPGGDPGGTSSWSFVTKYDDIIYMSISQPLIYGVRNDGAVFIREAASLAELPSTKSSGASWAYWLPVGTIGNVFGIYASNGNLYFSHGDGVQRAEAFPRTENLPKSTFDNIANVAALASSNESIFASKSTGELLSHSISQPGSTWTNIGDAENVIAMTVAKGWLFAATSDHKLLIRGAIADNLPWTQIGDGYNIISLASQKSRLYALTDDGNLWIHELSLGNFSGEQTFLPYWQLIATTLHLSAIARHTGVPLTALSNWLTASSNNIYQWCLAAIRASLPEEQYLSVLKILHDPVRESLRDAMVSWLITHPRVQNTEIVAPFENAEAISHYLFTDVQMSACMASSRVQFGYAAVQRFIDDMRMGFEPGIEDVEEQELFEREWSWRRFYRLWEANRRVFAYPENWLEPDLRPDKTPFFQELEDELMEGPLTTESAENAISNYLSKLVEVSRPEIIGIVQEEGITDTNVPLGFRDPELQGTHVFARSRSQPHQLYYRRRLPQSDHRWTPWERINADLPGTHFIVMIVYRRLRLIAAQFSYGRAQPKNCDCEAALEKNHIENTGQKAHLELSWIDRMHGKWLSRKSSGGIEFDLSGVEFEYLDGNDDWLDFPADRFPEKIIPGDNLVASVEVYLRVSPDGTGKANSDTLEVFLKLSSSGLSSLGFLRQQNQAPTQAWNPGDIVIESFILTDVERENVEGIQLKFNPTGGADLLVENMHFTFYKQGHTPIDLPIIDNGGADGHHYFEFIAPTDPGSNYHDPAHRNDPNDPLVRANDMFEIEFQLNPEPTRTIDWRGWTIDERRAWFAIEDFEWDSPPSEVYALHAHSANIPQGEPVELRLTTQEGVTVCRRRRRQFRFIAFDEFPDLRGYWSEDWIPGEDLCVKQTVKNQVISLIELFSDGSLTSKSPSNPLSDWLQRGEYKDTTPWGQYFLSPVFGDKPFNVGAELRAISLPRPYQLTLPAKGPVSTDLSPSIVEEISSNGDGRTLFLTQQIENVYFESFWHSSSGGLLRLLLEYGIPRVLSYPAQTLSDPKLEDELDGVDFFESYNPDSVIVAGDYPDGDIDFSVKGAYSDYNWELFLHAPLLIAQRLSESGHFEEADRWFRLLFDPSHGRLSENPTESFQTRPLRSAPNVRLEDLLALLHTEERNKFSEQVRRLNYSPYQPHLIARLRLSAYQKALVIKYLNHLLAWGDEMFRRAYASDNRTELEIAGSRYDLVARILGYRPDPLPAANVDIAFSFDTLAEDRDELDLWDPLIRVEDYFQDNATKFGNPGSPPDSSGGSTGPGNPGESPGTGSGPEGPGNPGEVPSTGDGIPHTLYFGVPHNERLLDLWDTLADRLWKMRRCRDIEGTERVLSLYGKQIDPGLLVHAIAIGLDIDVLLGNLSIPLSQYRFNALFQRAKGACDRAQSFGQAFLSTIEKRESEELARLRSRNEVELLRATKQVRSEQTEEAHASLESLLKSRKSAETRYQFYSTRERLSSHEIAEIEYLEHAAKSEQIASSASTASADRALLPNVVQTASTGYRYPPSSGYVDTGTSISYNFGGPFFSNIEQQKASAANYMANLHRAEAGRLGRQGSYNRRWEDWQLQKDLAQKDMEQIDKQIASAEIRLRITEIEQENQQLQIDQASTVDAYLRDKFTNAQLYRWMESRLSRLHYQQYQLAYDLALKAQQALRFELGLDDDNALLPDTWDPSHRGLNAAADLQLELEKMENQYIELWKREHEKQKVFSLVDRWPLEFLELRQTGSCIIRILESHLDEDEPGDYYRRIKQVAVDIPCVRGPDITVNARITLLRSEVRKKAGGPYPRPTDDSGGKANGYFRDEMGGEHIVTTTGVNDTGQLDSSANNDKRAPFEGWGAISTWQIDLDEETNFFDRSTISDVKLRITYTARDGGPNAKASALEARKTQLINQGREVLLPLNTIFSDMWAKFTREDAADRDLSIKLTNDLLPYHLQRYGGSTIVEASLYFSGVSSDKLTITNPEGELYDVVNDDRPHRKLVQYRLADPPVMDSDLVLSLDSSSTIPMAGWLLLWIKPETAVRIQTKERVTQKTRAPLPEEGVT